MGQVLRAGSPLRGVDHHVHCRSPVSGIEGIEEAGHVHGVAAHADDDVVLHDQRGRGGEVLLAGVGVILSPEFMTGVCVQGDEPVVGREEIDAAFPDAYAALPDKVAAMVDPVVVPDFFSSARIEGPDVIGNGHVEHAVDEQRACT